MQLWVMFVAVWFFNVYLKLLSGGCFLEPCGGFGRRCGEVAGPRLRVRQTWPRIWVDALEARDFG